MHLSIERALDGLEAVDLAVLAGDADLFGLRHVKGTRSVMGEPTDIVCWVNGWSVGKKRSELSPEGQVVL